MTPIPESGLDYLVLSKVDAAALSKYFQHQYIHYDDVDTHAAVTKVIQFVERQDESIETNRDGVGESRPEHEQLRLSGDDWDNKDGANLSSGKVEGTTESTEG